MSSYIIWNGNSSADYGLTIEKYPGIYMPQQKFDSEDIPGRNGTVYFYEDAWENHEEEYEVYAAKNTEYTLQEVWRQIGKWLYADNTATPTYEDYINLTYNGYHLFQDSYDPDVIRLATFAEEVEIENTVNKIGRTELIFNFRPEKFSADAFTAKVIERIYNEEWTSAEPYTCEVEIKNETDRIAKPIILIPNTKYPYDITLTVANTEQGVSQTISIENDGSVGTFIIDSETQNVFDTQMSNLNSLVSSDSEFPLLYPGTNTITYEGSTYPTTSDWDVFTIYPRWWSL